MSTLRYQSLNCRRLLLPHKSTWLRHHLIPQIFFLSIRFLLAQQEIKERDLQQARVEQEKLEQTNLALASDAKQKELEVALLQKQTEVDQATLREKIALALQADQKSRIALQALDAEKRSTLMIMQVHDELVFEVPEGEVEWVRTEIPRLMAGVADLKVPLLAEVGVGPNWDKAH